MFSTVITLYIRNCSAYCNIYEKNLTNAIEKHAANVLADSIIGIKLRFGANKSETPEKNLRQLRQGTSLACLLSAERIKLPKKVFPVLKRLYKGVLKTNQFYYCGKNNLLIETLGFDKTRTHFEVPQTMCVTSRKKISVFRDTSCNHHSASAEIKLGQFPDLLSVWQILYESLQEDICIKDHYNISVKPNNNSKARMITNVPHNI